MPSTITHAMIALVGGKIFAGRKMPWRFWIATVAVALLPDVDTIGLRLGVPYEHFFGHRGFFHSPFFGLCLSLACVCIVFRDHKIFSRGWWSLLAFFSFISVSHSLLDACTSGGLGIALLAPFDNTRYFMPYRPIIVSPIGFGAFFSEWGLAVLVSEARWIWLPLSITAVIVNMFRKIKCH